MLIYVNTYRLFAPLPSPFGSRLSLPPRLRLGCLQHRFARPLGIVLGIALGFACVACRHASRVCFPRSASPRVLNFLKFP